MNTTNRKPGSAKVSNVTQNARVWVRHTTSLATAMARNASARRRVRIIHPARSIGRNSSMTNSSQLCPRNSPIPSNAANRP